MRAALPLIFLIVAGALLLGSNGMTATLLGVRGTLEGFVGLEIALLMTAYYVGFIAGCRQAPRIIQEVGHIRAFTAFASVASAVAMSHALFVESWFWIVTRVITGFCFAGLQMIIESWLNERASNENRGQVLSVYRIADLVSATFFQAILPVFDPRTFVPFGVLTIVISFALVPVALTRSPAPAIPTSHKLDLGRLWRVSPLAAFGAASLGLAVSAYWAMGSLFVSGLGYAPEQTGLFVGAIIFGGAVSQWPVGALSDRFDRRHVLIVVSVVAASVAMLVPLVAGLGSNGLLAAGALFGISAVPAFGLVIAHGNDHAEQGDSVAVNGGILLVYGFAAATGPLLASQVMRFFGSSALFYMIALIYLVLAAFGLLRLTQRAAPETTEDYVPVLRTQPGIFELDPRVDPSEDEEAPAEEPAETGTRV